MTPLHCGKGHSASVAELLLRGADGAVQNNYGYRRAAAAETRRPQQPPRAQDHAEATGGTEWEARAI